jgi:hypothetical protein
MNNMLTINKIVTTTRTTTPKKNNERSNNLATTARNQALKNCWKSSNSSNLNKGRQSQLLG